MSSAKEPKDPADVPLVRDNVKATHLYQDTVGPLQSGAGLRARYEDGEYSPGQRERQKNTKLP